MWISTWTSTTSDPTPRPSGAAPYRSGSIDFVDGERVPWSVSERDSRHDSGAPCDWCLIFASENAIRRVWIYPSSWRQLSASDLEALSWMPGGSAPPQAKAS